MSSQGGERSGPQVHRFNVGPLDNNTYVVADPVERQAVLIDPSFGSRDIWSFIQSQGWTLTAVLNTHAHIDHVVENRYFVDQSGAPLALHRSDLELLGVMVQQAAWLGVRAPEPCTPSLFLEAETAFPVGSFSLSVVHTPGHSPGSVAFLAGSFAIVGDVLFAGSIGRTDLPGGDHRQLLKSIHTHLMALPDDTVVWPGHGPETTIGTERRSNPFLQEVA